MPSALLATSAARNRDAASPGVSHAEWPMSKYTFVCAEPDLSFLPAYAIEALVWFCWSPLWQFDMSGRTSGSSTIAAGRPAMPAATWSIHARYASCDGAPPPLGPPQSRLGML